ncbi:MAG: hypothetical protein EON57_03615 [Alphaproteobacteria bacterium]|nr:MAG: hypothetical protein EON57_03615 [Alphaproteobacteria bacterium]
MPGKKIHALAAALTLLLAGCNTDGLTPQAEIPGAKPEETVQVEKQRPVDVAEAPQEQLPMIDSEPATTSDRAPQNTLEAQAQAIEQGQDNPSLTKPRDGNLGANLYRSDSQQQVSSLYTATTAKSTIRFLPIIGAPVQAVTPLSKELGASARGNGLTIKGSGDETAEHVLKGYLSAFADGDKVTIVYVWDVLDNAGARLHRIQGQQSVKGSGSDAWAAVPADVMREIGVATIAEYMRWRQPQS